MGRVDAERVEQAEGIGGHVGQEVGRVRACRPASAAVIAAITSISGSTSILVDSPTSRLSKRITKKPRSTRPWQNSSSHDDQLGAQTHDQQQRRVGRIPHGLVLDLDAVRRGCASAHGRQS